MKNRIALNGATTGGDLLADLRAASEAGYDAIEIPDSKLDAYLLMGGTLASLTRQLERYDLSVLGVGALEEATLLDGAERGAMLARCEVLCKRASILRAPYIVVVPNPTPSAASGQWICATTVESLNRFADICMRFDVRIGFEFLGFASCSIRTLAAARDVVARVNNPTVGLALDTFHFYVSGSPLEDLDSVHAERVFFVHISDAEERPVAELTDDHRLLPGDGVIPLNEIVKKLDTIGYRGYYSLELFRPEYWTRDPIELARQGRQKMDAIFESIGDDQGAGQKGGAGNTDVRM
jgi:2-keto-myo-inositol isomerase